MRKIVLAIITTIAAVFLMMGTSVAVTDCIARKNAEKASAAEIAAETVTNRSVAVKKTANPAEVGKKTDRSFTLAWLTDPQGYSEDRPDIFQSMTRWIAENAKQRNIIYTIVTGDIVNHYNAKGEWANADEALGQLGAVPLFTVAGNHDIDSHNQRYEAYLDYFGERRFEKLPTNGGFYKGGQGRYDIIDINGAKLLLLSVGYGIDKNGLSWMNYVLAQYPKHTAILCVHGYIDPDLSYTSDGLKLFPEVVEKNKNIKLVLCGHRHGVNHSATELDDDGDGKPDRTVYALVADYQDEENFGNGYFCLLTLDPDKQTLAVRTYSPYLDDYNCYPGAGGLEEFTIPLEF